MVIKNIEAHDLLIVPATSFKSSIKPLPVWALPLLQGDVPLVCRRGISKNPEEVLVGLRGPKRGERLAGVVLQSEIKKVIKPWEVYSEFFLDRISEDRLKLPVFKTLSQLKDSDILLSYKWGVGGSLGFELAFNEKAVKETSDIDLLIYRKEPFDKVEAFSLLKEITGIANNIDIQIVNSFGGFALKEFVKSDTVLMKTNTGPILTSQPWTKKLSY